MRFIDQAGTVIRSKTANIAAGGSTTLEYRGPSVLYRVQAEIFESSDLINRTSRRNVEPSEERKSPFLLQRRTRFPADRPRSDEGYVRQRQLALTDSRCRRQWFGPPYVASSSV